jgi:hypothetical protein
MKKTSTGSTLATLLGSAAIMMSMQAIAADQVKVNLTGAEETPPVKSEAQATGTLIIGEDHSVRGVIKSIGIQGTVAHIHTGAKGEAGPPIITLEKGEEGTWVVPAGAKLTDEQFAAYKAGKLYVNIHSDAHKPGEIRAQMNPTMMK